MKILQINSCHYRRGGADVVYLNTIDLLRQHGNEVYCFSMQHENNLPVAGASYFPPSNSARNVSTLQKIKTVPSFLNNKIAAARLEKMLDDIQPDVAHIHLFLGSLSTSILKVLKKRKIPIVMSVHDYRLICPSYLFLDGKNNICERCKGGFYLNCTIRKCSENNFFQSLLLTTEAYYRKYRVNPLEYIDRFIFVSDFIRNKHIEFNDAYSGKEALLYNFIPEIEKTEARHTKGKYFLFYGRLSREKGVDTLVKAAQKAGVPVKIVGTGSLSKNYEQTDYPGIEFLGHKTGTELWDLVSNASFIIVPSEWYENNPLTILEAYGWGKPVIGARIGGIPEIVQEGDTGFLFSSGNPEELADRLLAADKVTETEYHRMSVAAREFARAHFSPDTHYEQLINLYQQITRDPKQSKQTH